MMLDYKDVKIGGDGIIVEVDETKLGKQNYNKGHHVEGVWCIAGVERTALKRSFVIPVEKIDSTTIQYILSKYIEQGSIVYTDQWAAYNQSCLNINLNHSTVNHSLFYKDPLTNVHPNNIEGFYNAFKIFIKPKNRNPKCVFSHLSYFLWSRKNKKK